MKFERIIERILKGVNIDNTFMAIGAVLIIVGIISDKDIALRTGFLTLIFGAIFRVLKIITERFSYDRRMSSSQNFVFAIFKFAFWIIAIAVYAVILNKIITIY